MGMLLDGEEAAGLARPRYISSRTLVPRGLA